MRYFILIYCLLVSLSIQAQVEETDSIDSPKVYAAAGIGFDYLGIGAKINYKLSDKTEAYVSFGTLGIGPATPGIGLEHYFLRQSKDQRLSPYISGLVDRSLRYFFLGAVSNGFVDIEERHVLGYTLVTGISYLFPPKRGSLNFGITYSNAFNRTSREEFKMEFQQEFGDEFELISSSLSSHNLAFTIGWRFPLQSLFQTKKTN